MSGVGKWFLMPDIRLLSFLSVPVVFDFLREEGEGDIFCLATGAA
jgi:hypothetical protein